MQTSVITTTTSEREVPKREVPKQEVFKQEVPKQEARKQEMPIQVRLNILEYVLEHL